MRSRCLACGSFGKGGLLLVEQGEHRYFLCKECAEGLDKLLGTDISGRKERKNEGVHVR